MASSTQPSCYCCEKSSSIDVDSALNELGMLSTVTTSHHQYLQEQKRQDKADDSTRFSFRIRKMSHPYPMVRVNRNFVGNIMFTSALGQPNDISINLHNEASTNDNISNLMTSNLSKMRDMMNVSRFQPIPSTSQCPTYNIEMSEIKRGDAFPQNLSDVMDTGSYFPNVDVELEARTRRLARVRLSRIRRFRRPYELPWHRVPYPPVNLQPSQTHCVAEQQLPLAMGFKLSISKSNNSSPVKGDQFPDSFSSPDSLDAGVTLVRSRSFDDLDFSRLKLNDADTHQRRHSVHQRDVESVSQDLGRLDVSQ